MGATAEGLPRPLTDLDPRWIKDGDTVVGLTLICPCCMKDRLTVFNRPTQFREQVRLMHLTMHTTPEDEYDWPVNWVPANRNCAWTLSNTQDFSKLTVKPSLDASVSGNWHGWITEGQVLNA